MRIFISYHTPDAGQVQQLVEGLKASCPGAEYYFAPRSNVGGTYWLPRLGSELAEADAVILLIGRKVGAWQELEYFEALKLNRRSGRPSIVPVLLHEGAVPGLPFLDHLHRLYLQAEPDETIAEIVAALDGASSSQAGPPPWRETNPYRGLEAFTSENAAFFFGRTALTLDLIEALATSRGRILTLVGNSGVGKSSLVMSGLFSALRSRCVAADTKRDWPASLADSHRWQTLVIRPGALPLKALALGFVRLWLDDPAEADAQANAWARNLADGSELIDLVAVASERLATLSGDVAPARFLLYVDQGEELYLRAESIQATRFSSILARAATAQELSILMSLRSDYYGSLQADAALFPVSRCIDVPPLTRSELEEVIAKPAAQLGARFEAPELISVVAEAAAKESGALPLLSVSMEDMWDAMRRDPDADGVLRIPVDAINLGRPLANRAEGFMAGHPDMGSPVQRLFTLRLAHVQKDGEAVRRRAVKSDCRPDEWEVALALAAPEWRLLTLGDEGGEAAVEVAHETLLHAWPRLAAWLEEEREFLIWRGQLEAARQEWESAPQEKRDEAVLMGLALATAREWLASRGEALTSADRAFVRRSCELDDQRREATLRDARLLAEERERSRRRATWISRVATAAALVSFALGGWALLERQRAESERDGAQTARAAAERAATTARAAEKEAEKNARVAERERDIAQVNAAKYFATESAGLDPARNGPLSVLLATEAVRLDYTTITDSALRAALTAYQWEPLAGHDWAVNDIALSTDGRYLASTGRDGTVRLWDLTDPKRPQRLLHRAAKAGTHVALGGNKLAAAVGGDILVWQLDNLDATPVRIAIGGDRVLAMALAPDGLGLVAAGDAETAKYWDLDAPGSRPIDITFGAPLYAAAFSGDSASLALGGESNRVALWRLDKLNEAPRILRAHQMEVYDLAFSGDSRHLASGGFEPLRQAAVTVWDLAAEDASPTAITQPAGPGDFGYTVTSIALGSRGERVLVGTAEGGEGSARLWLPQDQSDNQVLMRAAHGVRSVAVSPGNWLAVADESGLIYLYDAHGSAAEPRVHPAGGGFVTALELIEDERLLVSGTTGGVVRVQHALRPGGEPVLEFAGEDTIHSLAFSKAGRRLAIGTESGRLMLARLDGSEAEPSDLGGGDGVVDPVCFDPSGRFLAVADQRGIRVTDSSRPDAPPARLDTGSGRVIALRAASDGSVQAVTQNSELLSWQAGATGTPVGRQSVGSGASSNAAFDPNGRWLALTKANNRLVVHDLKRSDAAAIELSTGFRGQTFSAAGYPVAFSPDGDWLAFAGGGGVWLWQVGNWSAAPVRLSGDQGGVLSVAFGERGRYLATGGVDGVARLWALPNTLMDRACARAGRNFTLSEWRQYWGARDYVRTCPQWPLPDDMMQSAAATFARDGNADDILRHLREAWLAGKPESEGVDIAALDARHRRILASALIDQATYFADPHSAASDMDTAMRRLDAAKRIAPQLDLASLDVAPGRWNKLCWHGALRGLAEKVLFACDLAVAGASLQQRPLYRDSRGVARALTGDIDGAIEDFEAFVAWLDQEPNPPAAAERRRDWLRALRQGENPLDPATLEALRRE